MIYYTINKIIDQDEDGWITSEQIVYGDGRTVTFIDLETAESYYSYFCFSKSTHHIAIHKAEDDDAWKWAKERFWFGLTIAPQDDPLISKCFTEKLIVED